MNDAAELLDEETRFLSPKRAGQANRVYRGLREAITSGTIPLGTILDSSRDLESGYRVDHHVVAAALRGLAREGLVHLHHLGARVVDVPISAAVKQTPEFVERAMRQRLADGVYKPGTFLLRTSTIAREFGLAAPAFRSAIQPLIHVGYLVGSVNPRGTLVTHDVAEVQPKELLTPAASRPRPVLHTLSALSRRSPLNHCWLDADAAGRDQGSPAHATAEGGCCSRVTECDIRALACGRALGAGGFPGCRTPSFPGVAVGVSAALHTRGMPSSDERSEPSPAAVVGWLELRTETLVYVPVRLVDVSRGCQNLADPQLCRDSEGDGGTGRRFRPLEGVP
ncbi:GntR family transcriptional regulator [Streptomyces sp. NPDC051172]|uniref:GntR family transcriptional regulator n=1 Tax=Streptomyces sp. NPDC051172 TaxID=3155796 RepID=UPI003425F249